MTISRRDEAGTERLGVLDGLRGVAVLLVLWYHVWEISFLPAPFAWLQFLPETGFIGVHLFFFLSGFVIAFPFVAAAAQNRAGPTWRHFAWRRFIKIVPSYLLCIGFAYAIGYAQRQPGASTLPDLLSHVFFVHTWFPQRYGTISGVLWTLSVEVEFYCIFPLVWWCFRRRPWVTAAAMIALAWIWRAGLAHCCYAGYFPTYEENLPGYLDIFAFGMLSSYVYVRLRGRAKAASTHVAATLVAAAGIALLIGALQSLYAYRAYELWSSVWQIDGRPVIGAAFAILAIGFLMSPGWLKVVLDNPPLRFLAAISYNLYLYHQTIARELLRLHVPPFVGDPHYDPGWQVRYTYVACSTTIAQAAAVTYLFERPLLRLGAPRLVRRPDGELRLEWTSKRSAAAASSKPPSRSP